VETLILPGFSIKNKDWAGEVGEALKGSTDTTTIYWDHWRTGNVDADWLVSETMNLDMSITGKRVSIIAKSIGTLIAVKLLGLNRGAIDKLILCGIPISDLSEDDMKEYDVLTDFPAKKILCLQNDRDNHGSFAETEKFIHSVNQNIRILSKPRSDHEYPYIDDFRDFLTSRKLIKLSDG